MALPEAVHGGSADATRGRTEDGPAPVAISLEDVQIGPCVSLTTFEHKVHGWGI